MMLNCHIILLRFWVKIVYVFLGVIFACYNFLRFVNISCIGIYEISLTLSRRESKFHNNIVLILDLLLIVIWINNQHISTLFYSNDVKAQTEMD